MMADKTMTVEELDRSLKNLVRRYLRVAATIALPPEFARDRPKEMRETILRYLCGLALCGKPSFALALFDPPVPLYMLQVWRKLDGFRELEEQARSVYEDILEHIYHEKCVADSNPASMERVMKAIRSDVYGDKTAKDNLPVKVVLEGIPRPERHERG